MNKRQKKKALKKRFMAMRIKIPLVTRNHRIYDMSQMANAFDTMLKNGRARVTTSDMGSHINLLVNPDELPEEMRQKLEDDDDFRSAFSMRALYKEDQTDNKTDSGSILSEDDLNQMMVYASKRKQIHDSTKDAVIVGDLFGPNAEECRDCFKDMVKHELPFDDMASIPNTFDIMMRRLTSNGKFSPDSQHPINKPKEEDAYD